MPRHWYHRLKKRGLGYVTFGQVAAPFGFGGAGPDVKVTRTDYVEKGLWKYRTTCGTPVGSISSVMMADWKWKVNWGYTPEEYLVKQPSDWRVLNYMSKGTALVCSPSTVPDVSHSCWQSTYYLRL